MNDLSEVNAHMGIRSFLSSLVRCMLLARHRIIRVVGSCEIEGGRRMVLVVVTVFVDEVEDGRRDRVVDLGVITWRTGERDGMG